MPGSDPRSSAIGSFTTSKRTLLAQYPANYLIILGSNSPAQGARARLGRGEGNVLFENENTKAIERLYLTRDASALPRAFIALVLVK